MTYIPVTCELAEGDTVVLDVPFTEADDHDETWQTYVLYQSTVGSG